MRHVTRRVRPGLRLGLLLAAACAVTGRARAAEAPSVDDVDGPTEADLALAPDGSMRARADSVTLDPRGRSLELVGDVRVDAAPFHLRSARIRLSRSSLGVEVDGHGRLAFCPCLGTPVTVEFDRAIVAPPGDLVLTHPRLRVYDVPIVALPYFWFRSERKWGVLPPDIEPRAADPSTTRGERR